VRLPGNANAFSVRMLDIGLGGMGLMSRDGAPPGYVHIQFRLGPDSGVFDIGGSVVRERIDAEHSVWGVQFHGVDLGTRTRLRDYVTRHQRMTEAV
jgi:c-di-GMP-binding flagellar brake protein YcgR